MIKLEKRGNNTLKYMQEKKTNTRVQYATQKSVEKQNILD